MSKKLMAAIICSTGLLALPAVAQTAKPDFITKQSTNEWRASKLVGVNVYGTDNKKIGDIDDVLLDQSGNAKAVVIGVGGFLGIGQKNVAVPFDALKWQDEGRTAASGSANNGASGTNATGAKQSAAERGYPDHAVLAMNKDQLKNAPDFKFASDTSSSSSNNKSGASTTAPANPAPAPAAPATTSH